MNPTMNCGLRVAVGNGMLTARCSASHSGVSVRLIDAASFMIASHLDVVGEITEGGAQVGVDLVGAFAGQRADVDLDRHGVGDDVDLHPARPATVAVDQVRRERRVGAGVEVRCGPDARDRVERGVDLRGVEEHRLELVGDVERGDLARPQLVEARSGPVVGQPLHHAGRLDQCVVAAERRRPVAGRSPHGEPPPRHALLGDVHPDEGRSSVAATAVQAAALGQHVVGADRIRVVVGHPPCPVRAAGLLVGDTEEQQVARRPEVRSGRATGRPPPSTP